MRHLVLLALVPVFLLSAGCQKVEKIQKAACREDTDCESGQLCDNYECIAREEKTCEVVIDGNPILQPAPHVVDFGEVETMTPLVQTVALHNIGNCTLTIFEASLADPNAGFSCDLCGQSGAFPVEIWPGRSIELTMGYTPTTPTRADTELVLLSDDKEYGTLRVPLKAQYNGTPALVATPAVVDFGFRPASGANGAPKIIGITNQGTGEAPITVESIELDPTSSQDFFITLIDGDPAPGDLPRDLAPARVDHNAAILVQVNYAPTTATDATGTLIIHSSLGNVTVPLKGTAAGQPHADVQPRHIDLGTVVLGTTSLATITITNTEGGSPLQVQASWTGQCQLDAGVPSQQNTDFTVLPQQIPDIAPNGYTEIQVAATATSEGQMQGILTLCTSDPQHPSFAIDVNAYGVLATGGQVVKVEMTFDNGSESFFDQDIRNVDMTLENPYGFVCNKQMPSPTNWGNFGTASWFAFAPKDEPERIILSDSHQDGTYRVQVSYMEDCSSIPTQIVASILGIGVEALLGYLTGGITIPGQDIGDIIQSVCVSHSGTSGTIRVSVNGAIVSEKGFNLGSKGDTQYVTDIIRTTNSSGSTFTAQ